MIRGNMRRRIWITAGDVILVGLRDYQNGTADVMHKYTTEEARALVAGGHVPESALAGPDAEGAEDSAVQFREDSSDDDANDVNVDEI